MHSVRSRWRARITQSLSSQNNLQMTEISSISFATTVIRRVTIQISVSDHWRISIRFQFYSLLLQKMKKSQCRLHTVRAQYKSRFRVKFSDRRKDFHCIRFCIYIDFIWYRYWDKYYFSALHSWTSVKMYREWTLTISIYWWSKSILFWSLLSEISIYWYLRTVTELWTYLLYFK